MAVFVLYVYLPTGFQIPEEGKGLLRSGTTEKQIFHHKTLQRAEWIRKKYQKKEGLI
ncbi:MAG TPA: hypothetical protein VN726_11920 [Hanamia sp.]|nr:hypothetical protein [Hanamia sp.]